MNRPVIIEMAGDAAGVPAAMAVRAEITPEALAALPRKLLDVACRIRTRETLFRDDEAVDQAAHAINGALLAAPALPSEPADDEPPPRRDTLCQELQQQCTDWGTYWRASDAHGVDLSHEQATELLRRALGVEVEIAAPAAAHSTPEAPSIAAAMLDAGEPPDAVILTHADSLADLHGTPRPDNPTPEATAAQHAVVAQATGAQADAWRPMDAAPLDGTLVRLLVKFDAHGIEDTDEPAITIGSHNDGEWNFVGWDWHRDEWTRGSGDLLGWLPLVEAQAPAAAVPPALTHQPTQEN